MAVLSKQKGTLHLESVSEEPAVYPQSLDAKDFKSSERMTSSFRIPSEDSSKFHIADNPRTCFVLRS